MSLYTSRSEFDLEKRVHFTNEIPPYDMYDGLNSVLQTTLWQWVLGYTKVSFDLPYASNVLVTNNDGTESVIKDRQTGIDAGEVYYKMVNGKIVEDVQYGPLESENKKYHKIEEYGVLIPEFDFMLHEVYRYLGAMYPDHPDYTELLTSNEFDDMITSAAAVIDYEPDNGFFDKLADSLQLDEDSKDIESAMIKIRNLKNEGFRKRVYGSKLGYRMLANDIYQTATVFPIATYLPIKPIDKNTLTFESGKSNQDFYFIKNNDTANKLYIIKEGDNVISDLSVYEDDYESVFTVYDINGNEITHIVEDEETNIFKISDLENIYTSYQSPLVSRTSLQTWNTENKKNYNETEYEKYIRQNDRIIDTYSKYYYKKFRLIDYDGSNSSYPEPEDKSIHIFGYTVPCHDYDIIEYPTGSDSSSNIKNAENYSTIKCSFTSSKDSSYVQTLNDDVPVINTDILNVGDEINLSYASSEEELVGTEVHSVRTTTLNYVDYQKIYVFPSFKDTTLSKSQFNGLKEAQKLEADGTPIFNDNNNMLSTYYSGFTLTDINQIVKSVDAIYNPYVNDTFLLKPSESLKYYPKNVELLGDTSVFAETPINSNDVALPIGSYIIINDITYKGTSNIGSIGEVTNFTKGFIQITVDNYGVDGETEDIIVPNDDSYAFVIENENGDLVVVEGRLEIKTYYSNNRYFISTEKLDIAAIPDIKTSGMMSLLYENYKTYAARLITLEAEMNDCISSTPGLRIDVAENYYSDDDNVYNEAKDIINASKLDYSYLLSLAKEYVSINEAINSWKKNREYIYETVTVSDDNGNTFETEKTLINTNCNVVMIASLIKPIDTAGLADDDKFIITQTDNLKEGNISNMSLGNFNVVCIYDYDRDNNNTTLVDNDCLETKNITVRNSSDKSKVTFYYRGVMDSVKAHTTFINSKNNQTNINYHSQSYSKLNDDIRNYLACDYDNENTVIITPQSRKTIQIESVIDVDTEGMENKISFESDEAREAFKSLSVGDIITGPSIDSDDNDVFIIKIGDNEITVNVDLQKSGTFILEYSIKRDAYPTDISDNLSQYKEDLYNNDLYEVYNPFEHGLWPSEDYPNVSLAILDSLPDISFYNVNNYWDNTNNSFSRVLEETHYDEYKVIKNENKYLIPSDIKFNNELFLELNLNKLIYYPTHASETKPILMSVDWLDYIENSLMYSSRATDVVNVGVNLMMETDTTGYMTLINGNTYTDPNIRLKFITLNNNGQNMWPEKNMNENDWTIPCYAQVGTGGSGRSRWFTNVASTVYPNIFGRTVFDDTKLDKDINEESDFYRKGGEVRNVGVYGKNDVYNTSSSSSKIYTSVENPLFEIPLGEYDTVIKYASTLQSNIATNLLSITQASFYSQTFTDLLKYFKDSDNIFRFIGSNITDSDILTTINTSNTNEYFQYAGIWKPTKVLNTTVSYDAYNVVYPENPINMTYYVVAEDVSLTLILHTDSNGKQYTTSETFNRTDILFRKNDKWYLKNFQYMGVLGDSIVSNEKHAVSELTLTYTGELKKYTSTDTIKSSITTYIEQNPKKFGSGDIDSDEINGSLYVGNMSIVMFDNSYYIIHLYEDNEVIKYNKSESISIDDFNKMFGPSVMVGNTINVIYKEFIDANETDIQNEIDNCMYPVIYYDGTNSYISYNNLGKKICIGTYNAGVTLTERLLQNYMINSGLFAKSNTTYISNIIPNSRFLSNGIITKTLDDCTSIEKLLSAMEEKDILDDSILYFVYIGTNSGSDDESGYYINRHWLSRYIEDNRQIEDGDRIALVRIDNSYTLFKINTDRVLGASLPISRWMNTPEAEMNIISGATETDGWDIQSKLDKFNTVIDLPRSYITEGSYNFDIILDPHFVAEGYLYENDETVDTTSDTTCRFCLSKGAVYYDSSNDCFYCYANIVTGVDTDGNNIFSEDLYKVAIKFNEQKYFKNVLNIAGIYQIKNSSISGETDIVETPTFTSISGVTFPLEKLASGDRLLQVKSMDLRSIYSNSLEPYFFSNYFTINYTIKGIAPYTSNNKTGNYLYLSYLQSNGDVTSELNFSADIEGLTPVSYTYDKDTNTYNVVSDMQNSSSLRFDINDGEGGDVDTLTLYDKKISRGALSEDSASSTSSGKVVDRDPAYFKNNLIVRGSINSNYPNVIYTPNVDGDLFRSAVNKINIGDTLVSAYALEDTGSEENFGISIYVNGTAIDEDVQLKSVYFANSQFRAVTEDGTVYYNDEIEVSSVTSKIDCNEADIYKWSINNKYKGRIINVGYTSDLGWYVEVALDEETDNDQSTKVSIICKMFIDADGAVTLSQAYESNYKKVFVDYDSSTIDGVSIGGDEQVTDDIDTENDTNTSTINGNKVTMHTLVSHTINEFNNDYDVPATINIKFPASLNKVDETIVIHNSTTTDSVYTETNSINIENDLSYSVYNGVTGDWDYIEQFYQNNNDTVSKWVTTVMDSVGKKEYTTDILTYSVPIRAFYVDDDFDINTLDEDAPSFTWTYVVTKKDTDADETVLAQVFYARLNDSLETAKSNGSVVVDPSLYFYTENVVAKACTIDSSNKTISIDDDGKKLTYKSVVEISNSYSIDADGQNIDNDCSTLTHVFSLSTSTDEPTKVELSNGQFALLIGGLYAGTYDYIDISSIETGSIDSDKLVEEGEILESDSNIGIRTVKAVNYFIGESLKITVEEESKSNTTWNTYMYNEDDTTYYTRQYNDPILTKLDEEGIVTGIGTYYNVLSDSVVEEPISVFYRDIVFNYAKLIQSEDDDKKMIYTVQDGYNSEPYFVDTLMTSNPNLSKNLLSDTIRTRAIVAQDKSEKYSIYAKGRSLFVKSPTSMVEYDSVDGTYKYSGKLTPLSYWKHANAPIFKDKMFMNIRNMIDARPSDVDDLINHSAEQMYTMLENFISDSDSNYSTYGLILNGKDITKDDVSYVRNVLNIFKELFNPEKVADGSHTYDFNYMPTYQDIKESMDEAKTNASNVWTTVTNRFERTETETSSKRQVILASNFLNTENPYDTVLINYDNENKQFIIRCYGFKLVNETVTDDLEVTGACKKTIVQIPNSIDGIPYYYQDIVIDDNDNEINYSYAYSYIAYYLSYYLFGNAESTELVNSTNLNRVQFTNDSLLLFDIYGNVNSIGLSYLHNKEDIENPDHWSHSAMPSSLTFTGKNSDISGYGILKLPTVEEKYSYTGDSIHIPNIDESEQVFKYLKVPSEAGMMSMTTFKSTCSYANERVILLGGYTITKEEFNNIYIEMNSDIYDESDLEKLDDTSVYKTVSNNLKNYYVPMVLYSTNNGMSFDIMSLDNEYEFKPWDTNTTGYIVSSILSADNEFKIFVKKSSSNATVRQEDYYFYLSQDDNGLFDFSKVTSTRLMDEYGDLGTAHEYDIDADTGLDDGLDSNGASSSNTSYLGTNSPTAALPTGSYKVLFTENNDTFNILSKKGLVAPLVVTSKSSGSITVSGSLVKKGNTIFDALISLDTTEDINDQMEYLNSQYFGDYINKFGKLRVPEVTKVDSYNNANRFYSYRELLSSEQKDETNEFYDSFGYPAVEEDIDYKLYEWKNIGTEEQPVYETVVMYNDNGNIIRLCDYSGSCLIYVNKNDTSNDGHIIVGTISQRADYPVNFYTKASKPLYDSIEEAQNATNSRIEDDVLESLLDTSTSKPLSMCWEGNPYISISLGNSESVPRIVRDYLFHESDDLEDFVNYLKTTSEELTGDYTTDSDMIEAIDDIKYTVDGESHSRYTPKYVYSSPESSLEESDNEQSSVKSGASSIVDHYYWFDNYLGIFPFKVKRYFEALAYVPYTFKKGTTAYKNYGFSSVWGDTSYIVDNPITGVYLSNFGYGGSRNNILDNDEYLWTDKLPWSLDPDAFDTGYLTNTRGELVYLVNATGAIIKSYEAETLRNIFDKYEVDTTNFNGQYSKVLKVYSSEDSSNEYTRTAYNLYNGGVDIFTPVSLFDLGTNDMDIQLWVFKTNELINIDTDTNGKYKISFKYFGKTSKSGYGLVDASDQFSYTVDSKGHGKITYKPGNDICSNNVDTLKNNKFNTSFYVDKNGNIEIYHLYVYLYVDDVQYTVIYRINNWYYNSEEGKYVNQGFSSRVSDDDDSEALSYDSTNGKVRIFRITGKSSASIKFNNFILYSSKDESGQYNLMTQSINDSSTTTDITFETTYGNNDNYTKKYISKIMNCVTSQSIKDDSWSMTFGSSTSDASDYIKVSETYQDVVTDSNGNKTINIVADISRQISLPIFCMGYVVSTVDIVYPEYTGEELDVDNYSVLYQSFCDNKRIGHFKLDTKYVDAFKNAKDAKSLFINIKDISKVNPTGCTDSCGIAYESISDGDTTFYFTSSNANSSPEIKIKAETYGIEGVYRKDSEGNYIIGEDGQPVKDVDMFSYIFDTESKTFEIVINPTSPINSKDGYVDCVLNSGIVIPGKPLKPNSDDGVDYFLNFYGDNGSICYEDENTLKIQILGFNKSKYAEDALCQTVYTNGTYGMVPCRKPKYNTFHELTNDLGYVINSGDDSILLSYDKSKDALTEISTVDKDSGIVAFSKKLDISEFNDGKPHYLLMKWLTQSTIGMELSMVRDSDTYTEVSLADKTIFTPDRVWFNPNGYSTPPVTIGNNIYNIENNAEFTKATYKNNNNYSIYRCNEKGHIVGYGEITGNDIYDYDTDSDGIPNGLEGYIADDDGNITSAAVEFELNPTTNTLNDAQIPSKPNYDSCQDWFKNEFYIEGKESNPYWQVLKVSSSFNSLKMIWEQTATVNKYIKSSHEMILKQLSDSEKFVNVSKTVNFENKNGNYVISDDADIVDLKDGSLRFLLSKPSSVYQLNSQFIKYGITAENPFYKNTIWDGNDIMVAGYLKSTYTVCSTENLADPRDKESEIQEVTELGLFNKNHQLIAYATFPPIEYRTSSQHISFTCYVKQGSCLDPNG